MPRIRRTYFRYVGCMSRRKFMLAHVAFAGLALIAVLFGMLALAAVAREADLQPGDTPFDALIALGGALGAALTVWAASALVVKRCRDAGLPAWPMLGALFLTPALDRLLLAPLAHARLAWPLEDMTPLGGAVIASAYLLLLCLPSQKQDYRTGPRRRSHGTTRALG